VAIEIHDHYSSLTMGARLLTFCMNLTSRKEWSLRRDYPPIDLMVFTYLNLYALSAKGVISGTSFILFYMLILCYTRFDNTMLCSDGWHSFRSFFMCFMVKTYAFSNRF
jgi:hypothetical protein